MAGEPVPGVQNCRIAAGTADFTKGPAMTRAEAVEAIGREVKAASATAAKTTGGGASTTAGTKAGTTTAKK